MAWTQQGSQFFNPDTNQYFTPQVMGGSGPSAFGVGTGTEGTISTPTGDLVDSPTGFDFWAAQGRQAPGTGFAPGGAGTTGDQPGMPTGKGWLSSTPAGSAQFQSKDEGLLSQLQGLAIPGAFLGAGALAGGLGGAAGAGDLGGIFAPQNIPYLQAGGAGSAFDLGGLTSSVLGGAAGGGAGASGVAGGSPESLISPQTSQALGLPSPTGVPSPTGAAPGATAPGVSPPVTPPTAPGGAAGGLPAAGGAPSSIAQAGTSVQSILDKMKQQLASNPFGAIGAGIGLAGLATGSKTQAGAPTAQQANQATGAISQTGQAAAGLSQDLINQYKSGNLSPSQQASVDQITQGTKNQINQYFASIGQSNSTSHQQALAQVDQQALAMKEQFLQNALQGGLNAIGVAQGPLNTVATYQLGQDKNLQQAFGNFASALGGIAGKSSATPTPATNTQTQGTVDTTQQPTEQTPPQGP